MKFGAIEAGGTKIVCAVGDEKLNIIDKVIIDTLDPESTMENVKDFFKKHYIFSLGIGLFGPIDINPYSSDYGTILHTSKLKWRNFNIISSLKEEISVPIKIDTDVNVAALGEYKMGYGMGKRSVLYITIGTGVGAGYVLEGKTLHGLTHPEMGHILVRQSVIDDFKGVCPIHGNCLEGLISGPSIEKRYGKKAHLLESNHEIWDFISDYIGQAVMAYTLILSPEIILIGGGVSQQKHLFPKIRMAYKKYMKGYIKHEILNDDLENYILYPKNGQMAGLYGALQLAIDKYDN